MTDDTKKVDVEVKVDVTLTGDDEETKQLVTASAQIVGAAYISRCCRSRAASRSRRSPPRSRINSTSAAPVIRT